MKENRIYLFTKIFHDIIRCKLKLENYQYQILNLGSDSSTDLLTICW